MDTNALMQSGILAVVGMLVVIIFMCLLIVLVKIFLFFAFRFFPVKDEEAPVYVVPSSAQVTKPAEEKIAAAIAGAVMSKEKKN